jgi:hypothetical protein
MNFRGMSDTVGIISALGVDDKAKTFSAVSKKTHVVSSTPRKQLKQKN